MADKATLLSEHITDQNQQVHVTIEEAKAIDGDLFDVHCKFSDGSEGKGEMLSVGGRTPKKGEEWKLQLESRKEVPTEVEGKKGKKSIEPTDRDVVCGYKI